MQPEAIRSRTAPLHEGGPAQTEDPSLADYMYGVMRRARAIVAVVFVTALIAAGISLLMPRWYAGTASFLPSPDESSATSLTAVFRGLWTPGGGLTETVQAGDLSVALMRSRNLQQQLIEEFDLVARYEVDDLEDALVELDSHLSFHVGQEGLVTVVVEDRDPEQAAAMANRMIELLDRFNAQKRMTGGRQTRAFIEGQLASVESDLRAAEDALESYMASTKAVPLSADVAESAAAGAALLTRKMELEIAMRVQGDVLSDQSEAMRQMRAELQEIDGQLESLPAVNVEFARLVRELKVQEQVHAFLRTQFEESRIREQEDTASLTPVDRATPPKLPWRPQKKRMVLAAAAVSGVMATLVALLLTYVDLLPSDSRRRAALAGTWSELRTFWMPGRRRPRPV